MSNWLGPLGLSRETILAHFPQGVAWLSAYDVTKNLGKLVRAVGRSFEDAWQFLFDLSREIDYRTGEQFLSEWETGLSLPDPCLPPATTVAERRQWIAFRLNKKRWNTEQDWHDIAALFGLTVRITQGWLVQEPALYQAKYPKRYDLFPKLGRFRVYIDILGQEFGGYPYDGTSVEDHKYPIPYGAHVPQSEFICLIERIKPANVLVIWNEWPAVGASGVGLTFDLEFDETYS